MRIDATPNHPCSTPLVGLLRTSQLDRSHTSTVQQWHETISVREF